MRGQTAARYFVYTASVDLHIASYSEENGIKERFLSDRRYKRGDAMTSDDEKRKKKINLLISTSTYTCSDILAFQKVGRRMPCNVRTK